MRETGFLRAPVLFSCLLSLVTCSLSRCQPFCIIMSFLDRLKFNRKRTRQQKRLILNIVLESNPVIRFVGRSWVHSINLVRQQHGEYHHMVPDFKKDPMKFYSYFKMTPETFQYTHERVAPLIYKQTSNFQKAISKEESFV